MNNYTFSIQKLAYSLIVICLITYILFIGKDILIPLTFAAFLAFMLKPICNKIEVYFPFRMLVVALTFVIALLPIVLIIFLFSIQFAEVYENLPSISEKIELGITDMLSKISNQIGLSEKATKELISENSSKFIQTPFSYLGLTLSLSTNLLVNIFLTVVYTFLLLLYRSTLKHFYLIQFRDQIKDKAEEFLHSAQKIIQKYLYGLVLLIGILGILNSVGLTLIGIDYAFFWGFLAAFLAIVPYIGTIIGGLLPFLYALATTGNYWQPALVIGLFMIIQTLEGNLITPKIVGSSIKINPLAAIVSLLLGSSLWGISGLILALPIVAIIRVIFSQIDFLKPVGLLLSDELYEKEAVFEEQFDKERFRIFSFFKKKKP